MNLLIGVMLAVIGVTDLAHAGNKVVEARGSVSIKLDYLGSQSICKNGNWDDGDKAVGVALSLGASCLKKDDVRQSETLDVSGRAIVAPWGEGKAEIMLGVEGRNECAAAQAKFTGLEMSSGAYELYVHDQAEPYGRAIVLSDTVIFDFPKGVTMTTTGKKGSYCTFTISSSAQTEFKIKK